MKIGLISAHLEGFKETTELGYETQQIKIELKKLNSTLILIDPTKLRYGIENNIAHASFQDIENKIININCIDALFVRRTRNFEEQIIDFIEFASRANPSLAIIDQLESYGRPTSKVESILRRTAKFNQPNTSVVTTASLVPEEIKYPVVAKPTHGASGKSVQTCKSFSELKDYLSNRDGFSAYSGYGTLVQEELNIDAEYRVMVVDGLALGCAIKEGGGNAAKGAKFLKYNGKNTSKIIDLAERVSKYLKQDISGVDIIESKGKLYLIECNRNPQFSEFDRATDTNSATPIAKMLLDRVSETEGISIEIPNVNVESVNGRPRIFIGSSSEGSPIAAEIQYGLQNCAIPVLWSQGIFNPSENTFSSLENALNHYDYAIFCLTSDDLTNYRGDFLSSPRDNVIFEAGLFIGKIGLSKVILLVDKSNWAKIPSDLHGVTLLTWESIENEDVRSRIAPAILDIKRFLGVT